MYIFNPEHDLCLANGDIHFVPPESAIAFGRDCASLTQFFRGLDEDADIGMHPDTIENQKAKIEGKEIKKIVPWGWNFVLRNELLKKGFDERLLASSEEIENICKLSHRKTALMGLEFLHYEGFANSNNQIKILPSTYRIGAKSVGEVELFLKHNPHIVLKAPLSGSGKGIRFVTGDLSHSDKGWCKNLIERHNCVVAEQRFTPIMEFAMLFKSTIEGEISFLGYSLFTAQNGAYRGNILASNEHILNTLTQIIDLRMIDNTRKGLEKFLSQQTKGKYEGFIGVDQFICTNYPPHSDNSEADREIFYNPLVEINFRMTMGVVARNIYDNFATNLNISDGSHIFEICRNKQNGKTSYSYHFRPLQLSRI